MNEELLKLLMQMVGATNNPAMNAFSTKLKDYFKNQQGSKAFALNADPLTMIDPYKVNPAWSYQEGGTVNKTGYTPGTPSMNNPFNIIPGNHITSKSMDGNTLLSVSPIYNTGVGESFLYKKGMSDIIDKNAIGFFETKIPFYKYGEVVEGEYEVEDNEDIKKELNNITKKGYKVTII